MPDSLERLLRQAMAKDPAARPQSAMELIRGLQSVEQELRLPLTHPILPADEPSGDTRGGDTIYRPRRGGGDMFSAGGPGAGLTGTPPTGGAAEGTWGPAAGYADPRTHGGQPAHAYGGHVHPGLPQPGGGQPLMTRQAARPGARPRRGK